MRARACVIVLFLVVACRAAPSRPPPAPIDVSVARARPSGPAIEAPPRVCAGALDVLSSLKRPMAVRVFVTRGVRSLARVDDALERLLDDYQRLSRGKLEVVVSDTTSDPAAREAAKAGGLVETPIPEGDVGPPLTGFMGLTFAYGGEADAIKVLPPDATDGLEFWVLNKMREIRERADGVTHAVGVLTGHGERRLSDPDLVPPPSSPTLQGVLSQYFPQNHLVDVDARQPIPASLEGLVVLQPATDLGDGEIRAIDRFFAGGGKALVVAASAVNVANGRATLGRHRIDRLLALYGVDLHEDAVVDVEAAWKANVYAASGPAAASFPALLDVRDDREGELDATSPIFFRMPEVVFPFASSLTIDRSVQPALTYRVLARSSPRASLESTAPRAPLAVSTWKAPREPKQAVLALLATGTLEGAARPSRLLVLSSSQFFANPFAIAAREAGDPSVKELGMPYAQAVDTSMILVAKNVLDWIAGDERLSECTGEIAPRPKP